MTYTPPIRRASAPIIADLWVMRHSFDAASGAALPDDVVLFSAGVPFKLRLFETKFFISTSFALATLQLRDGMNGAGSVLSDVLLASATGMVTSSLRSSTTVLQAGSSLVLRRSNRRVGGEVVLYVAPET